MHSGADVALIPQDEVSRRKYNKAGAALQLTRTWRSPTGLETSYDINLIARHNKLTLAEWRKLYWLN